MCWCRVGRSRDGRIGLPIPRRGARLPRAASVLLACFTFGLATISDALSATGATMALSSLSLAA